MLEYRRYRDAAAHLAELFAEGRDYLYRSAPLPPGAAPRRARRRPPGLRARPARGLDRRPAARAAAARTPATSARPSRSSAACGCCASCSPARGDARLRRELRRRGQADPGGDAVRAARAPQAAARRPGSRARSSAPIDESRRRPDESSLEQVVEALLFLSPEPVSTAELAEACEATEAEVDRALDLLGAALDGRGVVLREVAGGHTLAAHPEAGRRGAAAAREARRRRRSPRRRPRRWRSSPTCSRSRGRRSRASAASPRSRRCRR